MAKIICVGFPKTGTTSLGVALENLGFSVDLFRPETMEDADWESADVDTHLRNKVFRILDAHDAIQDAPCAFFHKEFDLAYPGAKFILTQRNTDNWIKSFANFFVGKTDRTRKWMYGIDRVAGNEDMLRQVYENKNAEIIDYFKDRPEDFLIMNLEQGDGWHELINFLGKDNLKPFPHEQKAVGGWNSRKVRRLRRILTQAFYLVVVIVLLVIWMQS